MLFPLLNAAQQTKVTAMFDNIQCNGEDWVCFLDEAYRGNWTAYAGDGTHSVTGADEYWSNV